MSDGVGFSIDAARLDRDGDRLTRRYLKAGTESVRDATKGLERSLEAATRGAVPGKLWQAWSSHSYPRSGGAAREPAGEVFVNGGGRTRGAIQFWTEPGTIRGREGQWLAIPLPAAGARGRQRWLTPLEWEAEHNIELEYVPRPGKWPLLVAQQGNLGRSGTIGRRSQKRAVADIGRASRISVPIFVLVPRVQFKNAVAIAPLVREADAQLAREFLKRSAAL